jgi:hypothetical protein
MNLGQVFEMHLGLAAKALGYKVASPSFNRVTTEQIKSELKKAGFEEDGKVQLYDGRSGEAFEERTAIGYSTNVNRVPGLRHESGGLKTLKNLRRVFAGGGPKTRSASEKAVESHPVGVLRD